MKLTQNEARGESITAGLASIDLRLHQNVEIKIRSNAFFPRATKPWICC